MVLKRPKTEYTTGHLFIANEKRPIFCCNYQNLILPAAWSKSGPESSFHDRTARLKSSGKLLADTVEATESKKFY